MGLAAPAYLSSESGAITDTYLYDAFGIQIGGIGTTPNHYRYTGEQWDEDLRMYYLRARYYRPELGRFWTMDGFEGRQGDPLSIHKYLYCACNPVDHRDSSGRDFGVLEALVVAGSLAILANTGCSSRSEPVPVTKKPRVRIYLTVDAGYSVDMQAFSKLLDNALPWAKVDVIVSQGRPLPTGRTGGKQKDLSALVPYWIIDAKLTSSDKVPVPGLNILKDKLGGKEEPRLGL